MTTPEQPKPADRADANAQPLESSPIVAALLKIMCMRQVLSCTASELLAELTATLPTRKIDDNYTTSILPHGWPKRANELGNLLRRLAPNLREVHDLDVRFVYVKRSRMIVIEQLNIIEGGE